MKNVKASLLSATNAFQLFRLTLLCFFAAASCRDVHADLAIEDFGVSYVTHNIGSVTYGWSFAVTTPISVDRVGIWDYSLDGLGEDHGVGIWDEAGTPLALTTVPQGTLAPVTGEFRMQDLPIPLQLDPGHSYIIGARYNGTDHFHAQYAGSVPTFAPEVIYADARYVIHPDIGTMAEFPTTIAPAREWINVGLNFQFTVIPEPRSIAVIPVALCFLATMFRGRVCVGVPGTRGAIDPGARRSWNSRRTLG
jgi:hypothetical protein